jgi:hypothetical protein
VLNSVITAVQSVFSVSLCVALNFATLVSHLTKSTRYIDGKFLTAEVISFAVLHNVQ